MKILGMNATTLAIGAVVGAAALLAIQNRSKFGVATALAIPPAAQAPWRQTCYSPKGMVAVPPWQEKCFSLPVSSPKPWW